MPNPTDIVKERVFGFIPHHNRNNLGMNDLVEAKNILGMKIYQNTKSYKLWLSKKIHRESVKEI